MRKIKIAGLLRFELRTAEAKYGYDNVLISESAPADFALVDAVSTAVHKDSYKTGFGMALFNLIFAAW
jgi:hypothetical protein